MPGEGVRAWAEKSKSRAVERAVAVAVEPGEVGVRAGELAPVDPPVVVAVEPRPASAQSYRVCATAFLNQPSPGPSWLPLRMSISIATHSGGSGQAAWTRPSR